MSAQPRNSRREGSQRWYDWRGQRFYSVTTMLDVALRRHGLEKWNRNKVAEAVIRNPELVALMLGKCESPDQCPKVTDLLDLCEKCGGTYRWLQDSPYAISSRAKEIGSAVHVAIDAHQLGHPAPPAALAIRPRMAQWQRFVEEWDPVFELSEATVYNRSQSYAGTLDVIVRLPLSKITREVAVAVGWPIPEDRDWLRILADYKSSVRGIYPEIALQLSAYRGAEFIGMPDGSEAPMPAVDGTMGIQITDDEYRLVPVSTDADLFNAFLYARELFRFSEVLSKRVIHPQLQLPVVVAA